MPVVVGVIGVKAVLALLAHHAVAGSGVAVVVPHAVAYHAATLTTHSCAALASHHAAVAATAVHNPALAAQHSALAAQSTVGAALSLTALGFSPFSVKFITLSLEKSARPHEEQAMAELVPMIPEIPPEERAAVAGFPEKCSYTDRRAPLALTRARYQ